MKLVVRRRASVLTLGLVLAGCGGGESSGVGGGVVSTTPPAAYTKLSDMTGNRTFQTGGVTYNFDSMRLSGGTTQNFGSGVTIAYDAAADSYTASWPVVAGTIFIAPVTFGPADLQPASPSLPNGVSYVKSSGNVSNQLTLIAPDGSVPLSYTVFGTWSTINTSDNGPFIANSGTFRTMIGGSPTLVSDMPKTGSANYTIGVGGTAIVTRAPGSDLGAPFPPSSPGSGSGGVTTIVDATPYPPGMEPVTTTYSLSGNSSGTFSANFASGAINTTLTLAGTVAGSAAAPVNFGTFTGTGTLTSGGPGYTGTLTGTPADGIFSGAFFGPQALETAFGYFLSGTKFSAAGGAGGTKQ